jgi:hypothetical protein
LASSSDLVSGTLLYVAAIVVPVEADVTLANFRGLLPYYYIIEGF